MAFNEKIADKIREFLANLPVVEEKRMFGGVCFMVNEKMCVGVIKDDMMCRIDPEIEVEVLENNNHCRPMDFTTRPMKGYIYVDEEGIKNRNKFEYWMNLCLAFNATAKKSNKRQKSGKGVRAKK